MDLPIPAGLKQEWAALRDAPAFPRTVGKGAGMGRAGQPLLARRALRGDACIAA